MITFYSIFRESQQDYERYRIPQHLIDEINDVHDLESIGALNGF